MINQSFWRRRRVLVTGHTGFKGGWLCLWLARLGARVTGFSLAPNTIPNLYEATAVGRHVNTVIGDVRDLNALRRAMGDAEPEIVFHLAAQPLVRASYAAPVDTYMVNVIGTVHVLEAARELEGVRAVVNVTSDKCYDNRETFSAYRETDSMGGHDPYSSSKGCAELVSSAYRRSYFEPRTQAGKPLSLVTVRAGNVIGGGDWADDRLIPDCMRSFSRGEMVSIRRPDAVRPWQHVLEPIAGYLMVAERAYAGDVLPASLNFGPRQADIRSVANIVRRIAEMWGEGASWTMNPGDGLHEAGLLMLDSTLARHTLGWESRLALDEALEETVSWYRRYYRGLDMEQVTVEQIARYEACLSVQVGAPEV